MSIKNLKKNVLQATDETKEQSGRGNSSAEGPSSQGEGTILQSTQTQGASERLRNSHNKCF